MALPDRSIRGVFRRDYKHIDNPPLKSYLTDDSIDDSNNPAVDANSVDTVDANTAVEPAIDPALTDASTFKATDSLIQNNDFDNDSLTAFDLVLQALSAWYLRPN